MTASVRGRIDVVEPKRRRDQPGIEPRHMAANDPHRRLVQLLDQPPRRIDRIAGPDGPIGEAGGADGGGGNDNRAGVQLVEPDQANAAIFESHPRKPPILFDGALAATARRQKQPTDEARFQIVRRKHPRHCSSPSDSAASSLHAIRARPARSCRGKLRTWSRPLWPLKLWPDTPPPPTATRT